MSTDRAIHNATRDSRPTPTPLNNRASRFARRSNSPYDNASPPHRTATTSGATPTHPSNRSTTEPPGTAAPVAFHSPTTRARSTSPNTSSRPTNVSGSAAICPSTRSTWSTSPWAVSSSNRSGR
ncbi:hypothetical protein GCM10022420_035620 [Streptomyces iranensis]